MAVIDVRGLTKRYRQGRGEPVTVLRDVDLCLEEGAVLGLLGPNGAGKTTLIKILAGLLRPDAGGGTVLGFDLGRQHAEIRAQVSLVAPTADVGIDNNLTVRQNLIFWAPIYGLHGAAARARIDALLAQLELSDKADAWPMHISAGQRQRLALARSLLAENRLVFLDEPTNKLDLEGVRSVRTMIAQLNRELGVTIVLTTHVMEEAEELCGEIALLHHGALVAHAPTAELTRSLSLTRPVTVTLRDVTPPDAVWLTRLSRLPGVTAVHAARRDAAGRVVLSAESTDLRATTPALLAHLRAGGLALASMQAEPVTLDDVFIALGAA
ncbi:MAG TPA: ABC transporter ATP-binding protein [Thermomicrobiaceae bacterium]|nr:ABC transporter ATP-binding protein [Thermomicrobiaceae bacterium]